ncbi:PTS fructose transporter subunit IIABC [Listeria fleischmannii]|jgi:PTS system fructose-specific IIC component|uniref:PTS system fructose subfamily transporter subunit IIC n=1 Tax=Listeria fleischmannii FSL S10-1203 TaxID=1265822 RepID=W7DR28_9LIST|nr:fructose-specific PTS transporter subunit EIIC [Listeria fleischmannii]EUJ61557.1 PTS system fructose subfamily transporter subunit IIC [Listeria fleischmannii FSL S10-1203]
MKITDLLSKDVMIMSLKARTKEAAIDEMIDSLNKNGKLNDPVLFKEEIMKRESESSTGIGEGIAMPHAKTKAVNTPTVVFAKSEAGLDYESLDGADAHLFFMIAATDGANETHLETLAALSRLLVHPDFVKSLKEAKTPDEVIALFDAEQGESEEASTKEEKQTDSDQFVVAVTACPTGIAHTYMAEDALKNKAKEMGVSIRVETNGSEGVKHRLTADEIERASGVIVAADKNVEMARFDGKHVLETPVSDGIRKPEELIQRALKQDAPVFHADHVKSEEASSEKVSVGSKIYKDLMNGISHMLPFVVGGGILMAISFLIEQFYPDSAVYQMLSAISGDKTGAFLFLIPILAGFIASSIADRPGLMPGMVGGLMAYTTGAGFLGGLAAGFLAGYIVLGLKKVFAGMPRSLDGLKPILLYPVFGLLITGGLMYFIVNPIFKVINDFLTTQLEGLGTANAAILGLVLGGMMAIDMGGPFNKAAYTFAIGVFTSTGDGAFMAAVMAGGMVPPLAIALATTLFRNKFTEQEKQAGITNYILGLSFITEGAIPFAAADPLRVITSSVIGSAIAGALTQIWTINVPAPHGGIFVAPLANKPVLFIVAILIGMVIAGLIYGFWKKPKEA